MARKPYHQSNISDLDEMSRNGEAPDILALGDSWFCYPMNNLLNSIFNLWHSGKIILAFGETGATLKELADAQNNYFREFKSFLQLYSRKIKLVLLSGGGNDLADMTDFPKLLKPDCHTKTTVADCFAPGEPAKFLETIRDRYAFLIDTVIRNAEDRSVLIAAHNYDYAIPTGKGFLGFGHWLKEPLDQCQVPDALRQDLIDILIDGFATQLSDLEQNYPNNFVFIKTAGTLTSPADWANELHPTPSGFEEIGNHYSRILRPLMKQRFQWNY